MSTFKNPFTDRKFQLTTQEAVDVRELISFLKDGNELSLLTREDGEKSIGVVKILEEGEELKEEHVISPLLVGNNQRLKKIFKWLTKGKQVEQMKESAV
jgi:hypothetical protein